MNSHNCFKELKVLKYSGNSEILSFLTNHCKEIESLKLFQVIYSLSLIQMKITLTHQFD